MRIIERRTADGQLVRLDYDPEKITSEEIEKFLGGINSVEVPFTKVVEKGDNYEVVRLSRFNVKILTDKKGEKLKGFFLGEGVLEIINPPDGRESVVLYISDSGFFRPGHPRPSSFYEFKDRESAIKAWEDIHSHFVQGCYKEKLEKVPGLIRRVSCGVFQPWFYAMADQQIVGDLVIPHEAREDHFFQFGRKFVVHPETIFGKNFPQIKTCWGIKVVTEKTSFYGNKEYKYRYVFWDDGDISRIDTDKIPSWIQPLEGESLLGQMALDAIREVSAGRKEKAEVVCADGSRVIIKWVPAKEGQKKHFKEAVYLITFLAKDGKEYQRTLEFRPRVGQTTAEDFLEQGLQKNGYCFLLSPATEKEEERLGVVKRILKIEMQAGSSRREGLKKWAGFFPNPKDRCGC